jgi:hypothetical protein
VFNEQRTRIACNVLAEGALKSHRFDESKPGCSILFEHEFFQTDATFRIMLWNYPNKAINSSSVRARKAANGLIGAGRGIGRTVGPAGLREGDGLFAARTAWAAAVTADANGVGGFAADVGGAGEGSTATRFGVGSNNSAGSSSGLGSSCRPGSTARGRPGWTVDSTVPSPAPRRGC